LRQAHYYNTCLLRCAAKALVDGSCVLREQHGALALIVLQVGVGGVGC
jgi:hypothetical protein